MRFNLHSTDRAKRIAKSLKKELADRDVMVALARSQYLSARIFGYRDWHDLEQSVGKAPPSADDSRVLPEEAAARRARHIGALVEAGIPSDVAAAVITAVHPTDSSGVAKPGTRQLVWTESDGVHRTKTPIGPYRIGPWTRMDSFLSFGADPAARPWSLSYDHGYMPVGGGLGNFATLEEAKRHLEEYVSQAMIARAEEAAMNRPRYEFAEGEDAPDTEWGPATAMVTFAEGLVLYETEKHSYFVLDESWSSKLPEEFRQETEDGFAWYLEQDTGQAIVMCFPSLFTDTEKRHARKVLEDSYPHALQLIQGSRSEKVSRRAKKEIVGPLSEWDVLQCDPDESRPGYWIVRAVRCEYWGSPAESDKKLFATHVFRVPDAAVSSWRRPEREGAFAPGRFEFEDELYELLEIGDDGPTSAYDDEDVEPDFPSR